MTAADALYTLTVDRPWTEPPPATPPRPVVDWRNEAGRPPELALHFEPTDRRPGCEYAYDRWTGEHVYRRDGREIRLDAPTTQDVEDALDEDEEKHGH